jgi:hypothetical protein
LTTLLKNENPHTVGCFCDPWHQEVRRWAGIDPSNAMMTGNEYIAPVQGRDYAGISPVAGIIVGSREQNVDVKVDVVPRA